MITYDKSNSLGRRTFLRGAGLALALPWFESFGSALGYGVTCRGVDLSDMAWLNICCTNY